MVYTLIDHRNEAINVQNFAVKPSTLTQLVVALMTSLLWSIRV